MSDIRLAGRPTDILPRRLNVPINARDIPEGPCAFKCRLNMEKLRAEPARYIVNVLGKSLRAIRALSEPAVAVSAKDAREEDLYGPWGVDSRECIACYHADKEEDGAYVVDDLRKLNFDRLGYYPGDDKDQTPIGFKFPHPLWGVRKEGYHIFTWKLSHKNEANPYELFVDFEAGIRDIEPKWFIDTLFNDRHGDKSKNFGSATNFLDTLSKQLTARENTFVYELLQNANDYPVPGQMVDVEFHITDRYLLFMHTGDKFNVRNISGICGINEKEKVANKQAIGYKGIGFKTVFLNNHYVYIRTGDYSFRFEEGAKQIVRQNAPWPVLPVWTEREEVDEEVSNVFDAADKRFQVQIALRPERKALLHKGNSCYEALFKDVFADANIILFVPNIRSVRVVINGKEERVCQRDSTVWEVGDYEVPVVREIQEAINETIERGLSKIPEKYKDYVGAKVSFACQHEGVIVKPVANAKLYCYLPTDVAWGLPFLMNTDMLPKGDRSDIETDVRLLDAEATNFNAFLSALAGHKLFDWLKDLLKSRRYKLGSVFALAPDFAKCKREHGKYEDFISAFERAFAARVATDTIVPVQGGLARTSDVVRDDTGLSSAGIVDDANLLRFSGMAPLYLPLPALRADADFNRFLDRYADKKQRFGWTELRQMVHRKECKAWLQVPEHNTAFLRFLLEKGRLDSFWEEELFINEVDGGLYAASELYVDVDAELADVSAFGDLMPRLSHTVREAFADDKDWQEQSAGKFRAFSPQQFVDSLLCDERKDDTLVKLRDKDVSVGFWRFLAKHGITQVQTVDYWCGWSTTTKMSVKTLPFFDDADAVVEGLPHFAFFSSVEGREVAAASWLQDVEGVQMAFISPDYDEQTQTYFQEKLGVRDFSHEIVMKEIVLDKTRAKNVQSAVSTKGQRQANIDFVCYCQCHAECFSDGSLKDYALLADDKEGGAWLVGAHPRFLPSMAYEEFVERAWVHKDWLYRVEDDYWKELPETDAEAMREFLREKFNVLNMTPDTAYDKVVRPNLRTIIADTKGQADADGSKNKDFVSYLDANYKLIVGERKDYDRFGGFRVASADGKDIAPCGAWLYDTKLENMAASAWLPRTAYAMCDKAYGTSKMLQRLGARTYSFRDFYDDAIVGHLDAINKAVSTLEDSVAFHDFIITRTARLTQEQVEQMRGAKVFLYDGTQAATAGGHRTLSVAAQRLVEAGLVSADNLDIIHPAYHPDTAKTYWKERLENEPYTKADFFAWAKKNTASLAQKLADEELNKTFWCWLRDNAPAEMPAWVQQLPVMLQGGDTATCSATTVYFSDAYMGGVCVEATVRRYDPTACFLAPAYVKQEDRDDVAAWKTFWERVGVKHDMVDILVGAIIPHLAEIDDATLPALLAKYRTELDAHYEDEGGVPSQLKALRVECRDGQFRSVADAVLVSCEEGEPFQYILLPEQIAEAEGDVRKLLADVVRAAGGTLIEKLAVWRQLKIDSYLALQDKPEAQEVHRQFVAELAALRNGEEGREKLRALKGWQNVKLRDKAGAWQEAKALTLGTAYKPKFDYEACGVELAYVADDYAACGASKLLCDMGARYDFLPADVPQLAVRACAVHFWTQFLTEDKVDKFKDVLQTAVCVPTPGGVKRARELYYGKAVGDYVKYIENSTEKAPAREIGRTEAAQALLAKLPFATKLRFADAIYAFVCCQGKEKRAQLLRWMLDDKGAANTEKLLDAYREDEHATWLNSKNEPLHITRLYALDSDDKGLEQTLGTNARVVNKDYFPASTDFRRACDMLRIKTIVQADLTMQPEDDRRVECANELRLYALVLAGVQGVEGWRERYEHYAEKLRALTLHRCKKIIIAYNEDAEISQSLLAFYEKGDDFYFTGDLNGGRVYTYFVEAFTRYIGVDGAVPKELAESLLESETAASSLIGEHNELMIDADFKQELERLCPQIKGTLQGNEATETDTDDVAGFSTDEATETDESDGNDEQTGDDGGEEAPDDTTPAGGGRSGRGGWERQPHQYPPHEPRRSTEDGLERMRPHGTPLELDSLPPTTKELDVLAKQGLTPEQIADSNTVAQLRIRQALIARGEEPEEDCGTFVRNNKRVATHRLRDGRRVQCLSAAAGVMYISPSVWRGVESGKCIICVYLNGNGSSFLWIDTIEDWRPEELSYDAVHPTGIADTIFNALEEERCCVVQGPPGSGKSHTIAAVVAEYLHRGRTVCATTMANKGLMELIQQKPLAECVEQGRVYKSNLAAEERRLAPCVRDTAGLGVPAGTLLCVTNYALSGAYSEKCVREDAVPSYDLVVIEEASQAFLATIAAFRQLGRRCLIVGDPMQLPPIAKPHHMANAWHAGTQVDGLRTFALEAGVKCYRITTTFRLTARSAALTALFYGGRLESVRREDMDFSAAHSPLFPAGGGALFCHTGDVACGALSPTATRLLRRVADTMAQSYPNRSLAFITPFRATLGELQSRFCGQDNDNILVETIDRIQGMTVDYAVLYIPLAHTPGFALDERRFNVATSRSRSTTLIVSDIDPEMFYTVPPTVRRFIKACRQVKVGR